MGLNEAQKKAVEEIKKNVIVNAGAGTGKTSVLTKRYIQILEKGNLEEGKEIESIVAITFTEKATQEMIDRIRKAIRENFSNGSKWRNLYRDLEKANISTIHSFCARILRECPIEANVDPNFKVLEKYQSERLLKESIKEVLIKGVNEDERVYKLLLAFGKDDINSLVKDLLSVYDKIRTVGIGFRELKDKVINQLNDFKLCNDDLTKIKDDMQYLMDNIRGRSKISSLKNNEIWAKFKEDKYAEEELPDILKILYDNLGINKKEQEKIDSLKETIIKVLLCFEKNNLEIYETVLDLLIDIDGIYEAKKKELGALDFEDLQLKVSKLLDNEIIRKRYQDKFKYIMIDEFQDVNELQKDIFYKLTSVNEKLDKSNLFVVGDPKQSIYGFRGADLDVFYDVMDDIEKAFGESITLDKNYRTVNTILEFINDIFSKLMDNYIKLSYDKISENDIDIEILENDELEVPEGEYKSQYNRIYESELIAKRIKELVSLGRFNYGDFAILFRASTRDNIYEEALIKYGIPFYNFGGKGFYEQREIIDLINALKAISNPFDAISTIGFLRSPMIGLSDETIYWILRLRDENTVFESMKKVIDNSMISSEENEKLKKAIDLIEYFYEIKHLYGLEYLVNELISKTFFIESLLLKQGGRQAVANVYKFLDIVKKFDNDGVQSLEDLIDYLEDVKDTDESQEKIYTEDANVVKILTIHKSKGLQFPVVIIPEMCSSSNSKFPKITFSKELGIGIDIDSCEYLYSKIKDELIEKEKEEMKRILYVAMTRAEKLLILGFQGANKGYKALIKDLIDYSKCRKISNIDIEAEENKPINLIEDELLKDEYVNIELPLLFEIQEFNKRKIEKFSISQYLVFRECKRKFYLDYYKKLTSIEDEDNIDLTDDRALDGLEKGNIVHKFCQHYKKGADINSFLEKITRSFGIPYTEKVYNEIKVYIDNFIKLYNDDYDETFVERPFYLKVNDYYITGVIDRINIRNGKAEILDYKTNKIDDLDYLVHKYTPQLQLYAYIVKEIMKLEIERARLVFLENGEVVDVPVDDESLRKNIENIEEFMNFVSSNSNLADYSKNNNCTLYCKHKSFCNLEQEVLH